MRPLHWSLDRLKDPKTLSLLVEIIERRRRTSESDRFKVVPLVFGLLPSGAIVRTRHDVRIKPLIREHLTTLGIHASEQLIDALKRIADQYFDSRTEAKKKRIGIENVRALQSIYKRLTEGQGNRCAVCGCPFDGSATETLDHIIPWRLLGDVHDGSNWQILCDTCNRGKREWLSALQSPLAYNWAYGLAESIRSEPSAEMRYVALALAGECEHDDCSATPRTAQLRVRLRSETGIAVPDNLVVLCDNHLKLNISSSSALAPAENRDAINSGIETKPLLVPAQQFERFASYILTKRLTSGGMAECYLATHEESGQDFFLKRVADGGRDEAHFQREASIYEKLERHGCEHTVRVVDLVREGGYSALVLERAQYDLSEYVKLRSDGALPTNEVKQIAQELIAGLRELHSAGIVHRDLKPDNILRCLDKWVLSDFGISKDQRSSFQNRTFRQAGTSGYAAPEQLLTGHEATAAADVFALGKVLVFLITGTTDVDRVLFRQWRALVKACTNDVPDERPSLVTTKELLDAISE